MNSETLPEHLFSGNERLKKQLQFIIEIDRLKSILRHTILTNRSRRENDAEHSWHLAVMAIILSEYAEDKNVDLTRVIKMLLIHDIVEIDAGDALIYDLTAQAAKAEKEKKAAERIFGLLPDDQRTEIYDLWQEFELRQTSESRFAAALDRLQPLIHNYLTEGHAWKENSVSREKVMNRNQHIAKGAPELWSFAQKLIQDAAAKGYLPVT